jgi:hypothetical protein
MWSYRRPNVAGYARFVSTEPSRCAGALTVGGGHRIFLHRSPHRELFPTARLVVGGHLDPDEIAEDGLAAPRLIGS